jgi:hypothetical protein
VCDLDVAKVDIRCCICCKLIVSSVSDVFRHMFQMFHLDVAYVAMALPACFKRVFQVFHTYVCKCFIWKLQKVDLDVAYVAMPIHTCFNHMIQVFHLFQTYVANVSSECFNSRSECCTAPVADRQRPAATACCCSWSATMGEPMCVPYAGACWARSLDFRMLALLFKKSVFPGQSRTWRCCRLLSSCYSSLNVLITPELLQWTS